MRIKMEDGSYVTLKADTKIECPDHSISVLWGALDPIQQLAFLSGLDTTGNVCILAPKRDVKSEAV